MQHYTNMVRGRCSLSSELPIFWELHTRQSPEFIQNGVKKTKTPFCFRIRQSATVTEITLSLGIVLLPPHDGSLDNRINKQVYKCKVDGKCMGVLAKFSPGCKSGCHCGCA